MYEKILEISKKLNSKFFINYDISKLTWFRAGGKTDIYCVISDENELEIILNNIDNIPFLVIGSGSNLLVRDGGFKGLIIKLGKSFNNLFIENNKIIIGASILAMCYNGTLKGEQFNVACGDRTSNNEILDHFKERFEDLEVTQAPFRSGDVMHTQADISDTVEVLGYETQVRFWEGLKKTFDWY